MKQRWICLLLVCVLLLTLMSACEEEDAEEMTAVTLSTQEATETTEATVETQATEEKRTQPSPVVLTPTAPVSEATEQTLPEETELLLTETTPETETEMQTELDLRAIAACCIGSPVSALYAAIGYPPNGSHYTSEPKFTDPSVIVENGELYYNGFTVYTYREYGEETVVGVS